METGFLFMNLSHRMTNNDSYGWDREGAPLDRDLITAIYPDDPDFG